MTSPVSLFNWFLPSSLPFFTHLDQNILSYTFFLAATSDWGYDGNWCNYANDALGKAGRAYEYINNPICSAKTSLPIEPKPKKLVRGTHHQAVQKPQPKTPQWALYQFTQYKLSLSLTCYLHLKHMIFILPMSYLSKLINILKKKYFSNNKW